MIRFFASKRRLIFHCVGTRLMPTYSTSPSPISRTVTCVSAPITALATVLWRSRATSRRSLRCKLSRRDRSRRLVRRIFLFVAHSTPFRTRGVGCRTAVFGTCVQLVRGSIKRLIAPVASLRRGRLSRRAPLEWQRSSFAAGLLLCLCCMGVVVLAFSLCRGMV